MLINQEFEELTAVTLTIIKRNENVNKHLNEIHVDDNAFDISSNFMRLE